MRQPDLFEEAATPSILREEARFGKWDAICGLPLDNGYSTKITGVRLAAYVDSFRKQRNLMCNEGD